MINRDEIYKFIDNYGIPYGTLVIIELNIQENDNDFLQKILLENDPTLEEITEKGTLIISKHTQWGIVEPRFPINFKLTKDEQVDVVLNWFYDTTGYKIKEFKTLFELPVLNGNPFLLVIDKGYNDSRLMLATETINGDLRINKKFNKYGFLQNNWIKTLGRISTINGDLYIDNEMENLGNLKIVNGNLIFSNHVYQSKLESLSPLKKVKGDLYLKNTHVSLGTLEEVKGNLNLRKTTVKDLGALKKVGGNILVSKSEKNNYNFSEIDIQGKIRYYNDTFNKGQLTLPNY
uniref:hypothetical protein n=1 Tax=Flavobacterium sp. TaxID=239 RepID=UPI0040487AAD